MSKGFVIGFLAGWFCCVLGFVVSPPYANGAAVLAFFIAFIYELKSNRANKGRQ